ncbi:MAG: hypothetical protein KYX69_09285 [Sphingomonas sp.]|uniref:hypothetical protein n=1 Tax=Sphingomonas sp. TaxID=28214 RepID=UPI00262CDC80|nr:hypothetical protein [Sphingomonas sp.]MDK2767898.1 hypothetical protein [Sphingomonas sp.]
MQFINDRARRIAEARVLGATVAIVRHAGWSLDRYAPALIAQKFADYLYVTEPELLLVPVIGDLHRAPINSLVRAARSDALCISISASDTGDLRVHGTVCEWTRQAQRWSEPRTAWLGDDDTLWFLPDATDSGPAFRVGTDRMERLDDHPTGERAAGFDRARTLFAYLGER